MVFNSAIFLICFLPLFFLCYYLLPARFRNAFLLVGSLGFYAWGDPGNILLLLAASAATYGFGRAMAPSACWTVWCCPRRRTLPGRTLTVPIAVT